MERVANRFVRWKNISADAEWHSGDKRTNTCIAVEFQNLRGQWCPRFEKRTSSLGQCFGLFAATVFVEGALVTVYCGRVQRSKRTPFCVDSKRYTAEITSEGKKKPRIVDSAGGPEYCFAHYINSGEEERGNLRLRPCGRLFATRDIAVGEELLFPYGGGFVM